MEEGNTKDVYVVNSNIMRNDSAKNEKTKHRKTLIKEIYYDYAKHTTIHGLSYTTKKDVTITEKVFWIMTFILSICLCSYLIHDLWIKWQTKPIIVTFSETLVPASEVPFPSVTICPQTKVIKSTYNYASEVERLRKILKENSTHDVEKIIKDVVMLEDLYQICKDSGVYSEMLDSVYFKQYEQDKHLYTDVVKSILKVAPIRFYTFVHCERNGQIQFGCILFTKVLTSEGLCYSFNSLAANEIIRDGITINFDAKKESVNWTMEHGYSDSPSKAYPTPGKSIGEKPDLSIFFMNDLSIYDERCNAAESEFIKVFIHHPADLPQASQYYSSVPNRASTSVALSFTVINTAKELTKYSSDIRQCYLPEERKLKYFKIYTENNCMMECAVNRTYNKYKCVEFYMPRDNNTRICTFEEFQRKEKDQYIYGDDNEEVKKCNCLPSCYSIDYQAETLKTNYNLNKKLRSKNPNMSYSSLQIFFKGTRFISMRRSELFGVTDFLANIGGILSLFLGFSFLSLIELLYYVTLRLCCVFKKDHKQENINK